MRLLGGLQGTDVAPAVVAIYCRISKVTGALTLP
jgi:hypothetical protein